MKHWVAIDMNNTFIPGNFEIEGSTLRKIGQYGSFQVLGRDPFPPSGRHYFSLFLEKINWSVFSVGIVNQSRRNYATSHQTADCLALFGVNGTIWQEHKSVGGGKSVPDGVQIRVVVDFIKRLARWYQDGL